MINTRYAPILTWYEAGRNYAAGDGWFVTSGKKAYRFGPLLLVAPPVCKKPAEESKFDFLFRVGLDKHKTEPIVEVNIISQVEYHDRDAGYE